MNTADFQESVRRALGGTATQMAAELALSAVIQAIRDGLREDGEVRLARFGTWRLQHRVPRRLRHPRTGQPMLLPERTVICFTPSPKAAKQPPTAQDTKNNG